MQKLQASITDTTVTLNMPMSKINKDTRIVSGFATIDSIDYQNDVLTADASKNAFAKFRGNVRESHDDKKAVGRVVSYEQKEFYDEQSGNMHSGIWVNVYVSKGAQDTWEKVLDGTLSGFSVQGPIKNKRSEYNPKIEKVIRYVTDYDLLELSLVDSPCNTMCNVLSIEKSIDGETTGMTGMAADVVIESVFWCKKDGLATVSQNDVEKCSTCDSDMSNLGWFEVVDGEERVEKIREILNKTEAIEKNLQSVEGGFNMAKEEVEAVQAEEENAATEEVVLDAEVEEEISENGAEQEPDLQGLHKGIKEIQQVLAEYNQNRTDESSVISDIKKSISDVESGVASKLEELLSKHQELATEFKSFKNELNTVEKRLNTVESGSAVKKSASVSGVESVGEKTNSIWSGSMLPVSFDK